MRYNRRCASGVLLICLVVFFATLSSREVRAQSLVVGVAGNASQVEIQEDINRRIGNLGLLRRVTINTVKIPEFPLDLINFLLEGHVTDPATPMPDVLVVNYPIARDLAADGLVLHLDDIVDRSATLRFDLEMVYPSALSVAQWEGRLIGIPRSVELGMIVYRSDLAEDAGIVIDNDWDWRDFSDVARKFNSGPSLAPPSARLEPASICSSPTCWLPFLWANGGGYLNASATGMAIHQAESRIALAWLQDQIASGAVGYYDGLTQGITLEGYIAMIPASSSTTAIQFGPSGNPAPPLRAALFPKSPHTGVSVSPMRHAWLYVVNRFSPNVEQAIEYLNHVLRADVHATMSQSFEWSARADVPLPMIPHLPDPAYLARAIGSARAFPPPTMPPTLDGTYIWISNETINQFMRGDIDVDAFVSQAVSLLESLGFEY